MENKSNDKKASESRRGSMKRVMNKYGIAVALLACALVVAGTWLFTDGRLLGGNAASPTPQASKDVQSGLSNDDRLNNVLNSAQATSPSPSARSTTAPVTQQAVPELTRPVAGTISKPFAYDSLVYMKTLNQWSTHPGIDIAASVGDDVVAALAGEVQDSYKDPLLGNCVKIKCANDVTMIYAGLLSVEDIKKGDKVETGELIGQVGNTASSEATEDPHLHFEVWAKGAPVNADLYLKK